MDYNASMARANRYFVPGYACHITVNSCRGLRRTAIATECCCERACGSLAFRCWTSASPAITSTCWRSPTKTSGSAGTSMDGMRGGGIVRVCAEHRVPHSRSPANGGRGGWHRGQCPGAKKDAGGLRSQCGKSCSPPTLRHQLGPKPPRQNDQPPLRWQCESVADTLLYDESVLAGCLLAPEESLKMPQCVTTLRPQRGYSVAKYDGRVG